MQVEKHLKFFNNLEWSYKNLPDHDCSVVIKFYTGDYSTAEYKNKKFIKDGKIIKFKKDFKKWSYYK